MNKEQLKVIKDNGGTWEMMELAMQPRMTMYTIDKNNGEIVEMPNLPADPYSLARYLRRGYKVSKNDLKPQARKGEGVDKSAGFTCEVCGKRVSSALALAGHKRTHQNKEK